MTFILYAFAEILANIIAYLTNPIICLFANEVGQLPKALRYWQTYDNPLDIQWMVEEVVPELFRYDFRKHYEYHREMSGSTYCLPGYVTLIDPKFTLKERIQRYFCRLMWMYRNTAYGFSYEVLSKAPYVHNLEVVKSYFYFSDDQLSFVRDKTSKWYDPTFKIYYKKPWCKFFYLRVYLGWKLTDDLITDKDSKNKAMLALYINPFRVR